MTLHLLAVLVAAAFAVAVGHALGSITLVAGGIFAGLFAIAFVIDERLRKDTGT